MINSKLIHTITVSRRTKSGTDVYGEPTYTYSNAYTSIKARVEVYRPKIFYKESGQDPEKDIIVYFDKDKVIQPQDIIIAVNVPGYTTSTEIGRVKEVVEAIMGTQNIIHHIEAQIEETHGV